MKLNDQDVDRLIADALQEERDSQLVHEKNLSKEEVWLSIEDEFKGKGKKVRER